MKADGAAPGPLRSMDARLKLAAALGSLAVALGGPAPWAPLGVAAAAAALSLGLGRRPSAVLRLVAVAAATGAFAAALHRWLGSAGTNQALMLGAVLASRMAAGTLVFTLFAFLTPPWALAAAAHSLRLPAALADVIALAIRYVSVLEHSARTAREAQLLRLGYLGFGRSLASLGELSGLTLLRAFDQAAATAEALAMRGCAEDGLVPMRRAR